MQLEVPSVEAPLNASLDSLSIESTARVDPASHPPAPSDFDTPARFLRYAHSKDGKWVARLLVHVFSQVPLEGADTGGLEIDIRLDLLRAEDVTEEVPEGVEGHLNWVVKVAGGGPARLTGVFNMREGVSRSRLPLPLQVPTLVLQNFDEINSVELVKWDNQLERIPLYSVIIQVIGHQTQIVARTVMVCDLSPNVLPAAIGTLLSVARFAAEIDG